MKKLKCFIASAFDKKDVDIIFTKVIRPVLRQQSITSIRVDRVEHNDDIDDKILELIEDCDFCIADLSYARPSVYYEAGRVHGMGKPVIFLARSDHFISKQDDLFGNFRIHFDLQMKNIIKWTSPTTTLQKRLGSRVKSVTNPLLKSLRKNEEKVQAQTSFGKLPQNEKFLTIAQFAESELKKRVRLEDVKGIRFDDKSYIFAVRKMRQKSIIVYFEIEASFTKSKLAYIGNSLPYGNIYLSNFLKNMNVDRNKSLTSHVFCCSLRSTPESRVADALPHFSPHEHFKIYSYGQRDLFHTGVLCINHLHFLDNIGSILEIQEQLKKHLPLIGKLDNSASPDDRLKVMVKD